jgi:hypothetical protein
LLYPKAFDLIAPKSYFIFAMPNTVCISGPAFSITGATSYTGEVVEFQLSFDSEADQDTVLAYEWYLDGIIIIGQNSPDFSDALSCGSHAIAARILTADGWSGVKRLSFRTCITVVSVAIIGPDTVAQGSSANYFVIESLSDGTTVDVTADYTLTCPDGTFAGGTFTPTINFEDSHPATITASKDEDTPLTKDITISSEGGYAGVLVVDLLDDATLNVIGLVDNAEVTNNHVPAYTNNNIIPGESLPADALILASDLVAGGGALKWRFEFNLAQLLINYPETMQFVFYIKGRGDAANSITVDYGTKKFATQMTLGGSPGSYIPGIDGGAEDNLHNGSALCAIVAGANGSYEEADLTTIIELTYDVAGKTIFISPLP